MADMMNGSFTASEVRRQASTFGRGRVNNMLRAFADLLEAQEKAVPVATVEDQFGFPIMEWIGDAGEKCPVGTNLYTHSTQAQPSAGSVTDAMPKVPVNADEVELEDACWNAWWSACRDVTLDAQENPNG